MTILDPPSVYGGPIAALDVDRGASYKGAAQSITAVDPHVDFGFFLNNYRGEDIVLYSLYAGDGVLTNPLKQVKVEVDMDEGQGVQPYLADFSDITLTPGDHYTFKVSNVDEDVPMHEDGQGASSNTFIYQAAEPYAGGRSYSVDPSPSAMDDGTGDFAFKLVGVSPTGTTPEPATWAVMIAGFVAVGATWRRRGGISFA